MIVEGRLINFDSEDYAQVEINQGTGLIERMGRSLGTPDLRLEHELVFPGFCDIHVHAREDVTGRHSYKETFRTASEAAINGGVVHIADMPNNPVAPVDDESYKAKLELTKSSLVDVTLYAGIGPCTAPLAFDVPYKLFMCQSVSDLFFASNEELERAVRRYAGRSVSFHCEDPAVLKACRYKPTHESRRPGKAEVSAIAFALELIAKYSLSGKVCHCSTRDGLEKILQAKQGGVDVACEVAPHHLYFDEGMLSEDSSWLQVNPPLRTADDRAALIEGLKSGSIEYLATDHAPHTRSEKERLVSGVPHLDTFGPFVTWLMRAHSFTPRDIARVCSYNPGVFLNRFSDEKFGRIEVGYVGSLTVVDMSSPVRISRSKLRTMCGWSPFEAFDAGGRFVYSFPFGGITFPGSVKHAIVRGKVY